MALKLIDPLVVRPNSQHQHDHWQGGAPLHQNAVCHRCDHPLLLIWDLDASDPRLAAKTGRPVFHRCDRLCLYWCVPCFAAIDYLLQPDGRFEMLSVNGQPVATAPKKERNPAFPYPDFPAEFERRAISLTRGSELPPVVRELMTAEPIPELTDETQKLLEEHVGHEVSARGFQFMRTWIHSVGGKPYMPQGDMSIVCRNNECRSFGKRMHALAAIHNDPPSGLPIIQPMHDVLKLPFKNVNEFVVVYFHLCKTCNSIHVESQGT